MKKVKAIILRNELEDDHNLWVRACEEYKSDIEYRIVNLISNKWIEEIQKLPFDIMLAKPGGLTASFKQLYDERIFILGNVLDYMIYPSPIEIFIYENKRFLSFWLKANNIPHPSTDVFYDRNEAYKYLEVGKFPFIAKTNIGASGSGVEIIWNRPEGCRYIEETFSGKGAPQRTGPNLTKGGILKRGFHYILHPSDISKKLNIYQTKTVNLQKGFVIFQEYIPHNYEWRVVCIGDSYFSHKKLAKRGKASGSLLKGYENPPMKLLDFVKEIMDKFEFRSQAVDVFETSEGKYLVNEMQCIFGQSDPYQMLVDGKPGRYRFMDNKWVFEEGDFASNQCYNLRLDYILKELS